MRMIRASIASYFGPTRDGAAVLQERRHWLDTAPENHLAECPEGTPLIAEWMQTAQAAGLDWNLNDAPASSGKISALARLGALAEPDLLFLRPVGNEFQLVAGCVCFPSSWSLAEKIRHELSTIHSVVPALNAELAAPITRFLRQLAPGIAWLRENWGLSASPARNQHPARQTPRLPALATLDSTWLRVERQALVALPRTGGVCFGIRVESYSLAELYADVEARSGLRGALETMPAAMAEYKGLAVARERLVGLLRD